MPTTEQEALAQGWRLCFSTIRNGRLFRAFRLHKGSYRTTVVVPVNN